MTEVVQVLGLTQGLTWKGSQRWDNNDPPVVLDPAQTRAYMVIAQLGETTPGVETEFTRKGVKRLFTFTSGGKGLEVFADRIDITISGEVSRRWRLQALEDPILRTVSGTDPATVTMGYPVQLLHAELHVVNIDGSPSVFDEPFRYEFLMRTGLVYA